MSDDRVTARSSSLADWLERLAEPTGDPGGGAAAGVMLAVSAALTSMVAGYEGRGSGSGRRAERMRERAIARRHAAVDAADADALASRDLGTALRMPSGEERDRAVREASVVATESSVRLGDLVLASIDDLTALAQAADAVLVADAAVAVAAARAALTSARANAGSDLARHGGSAAEDGTPPSPLAEALTRFDDGLARLAELESSLAPHLAPPAHD